MKAYLKFRERETSQTSIVKTGTLYYIETAKALGQLRAQSRLLNRTCLTRFSACPWNKHDIKVFLIHTGNSTVFHSRNL